jgi:hypothetical protein
LPCEAVLLAGQFQTPPGQDSGKSGRDTSCQLETDISSVVLRAQALCCGKALWNKQPKRGSQEDAEHCCENGRSYSEHH